MTATATPEVTATATATAASTDTADPVRAELEWFLGVLAGNEISEAEYEERFAQSFRDAVPYDMFVAVVEQLRPGSPYTLTEVEQRGELGLSATITAADGTALVVHLDLDADGRIAGLVVQPAEPPQLDDPPTSPLEAAARLEELGTVRMLGARVEGSSCTPLLGPGQEEAAPLGSTFKLWVLGAVADAIAAGSLAWNQELTLTEADLSLGGGVLMDREVGSTVPVLEAAELMIEISDNTATDLLLHTVGREAVEAAQAAYGHSDPALNTPFMTTRELFALKVADEDTQQAWLDGDVASRRAVLDALAAVPREDISLDEFVDPVQPDVLEWFATPGDLCRALATLWQRGAEAGLEPLRTILTANPGVPGPEGRWTTIAFKGGSEPGLAAVAWLVEDADGELAALTGSVVNPDEAFDITEAVLLFAAARDTLPV